MVSTYILLLQITERCCVLIYILCLLPKIALYIECGECFVTLKTADTPLKTNKQQLMDPFVNTSYHKLYFKGNVPVPRLHHHIEISFLWEEGHYSEGHRAGGQMESQSTNTHSGSAFPGGTSSVRPVTRRGSKITENVFHKELFSWGGKGCYTKLTLFYVEQQHHCANSWQKNKTKDAAGVGRGVQPGPVPEVRNI